MREFCNHPELQRMGPAEQVTTLLDFVQFSHRAVSMRKALLTKLGWNDLPQTNHRWRSCQSSDSCIVPSLPFAPTLYDNIEQCMRQRVHSAGSSVNPFDIMLLENSTSSVNVKTLFNSSSTVRNFCLGAVQKCHQHITISHPQHRLARCFMNPLVLFAIQQTLESKWQEKVNYRSPKTTHLG